MNGVALHRDCSNMSNSCEDGGDIQPEEIAR